MPLTPDRPETVPAASLVVMLRDARSRTLELVRDLDDGEWLGPRLAMVNPFLWEIGHLSWFQERWTLRHLGGRGPLRADGDDLYDSAIVPHEARWDLPLPPRRETLSHAERVLEAVTGRLLDGPDDLDWREAWFHRLVIFHEDMHGEALAMTRHVVGLPPPPFIAATQAPDSAPASVADRSISGETGARDVVIPAGTHWLGAPRRAPFVFDNEKWAHPVHVPAYVISRRPVTQAEFAAFVEDGGYSEPRLWSPTGWRWRELNGISAPAGWRRDGGIWQRRRFDRWLPLRGDLPMAQVSWHEAQAWCRWAGRRLPTEAEWERAALGEEASGTLPPSGRNRPFPWGEGPASQERANLDGVACGVVAVGDLPGGDAQGGLRQMIGNIWEWTESPFLPFPGFRPDPYGEYSLPWFGTHMVLRGGCWLTRSRLLRTTWRNFYVPERQDAWAGFRTCAL